jgi:carbon monoxide dehydrogenase subunit G
MRFENSFTVDARAQDVWATLMDLERVAPCMPGAEVLEHVRDDAYKVAVKVKLGPISMQYQGEVEIVEKDEDARHATMQAKAREARGQGTANALIRMGLVEQPDGTHATIETDLQLSGRAAAMGRGVIVEVASNLVEQFATNLARLVGQPPEAVAEASAEGEPVSPAPGQAAPVAANGGSDGEALEIGKIAASVIAGRLGDPRTLLLSTAGVAAVFLAIGYAIGRSR